MSKRNHLLLVAAEISDDPAEVSAFVHALAEFFRRGLAAQRAADAAIEAGSSPPKGASTKVPQITGRKPRQIKGKEG
jgi:hypothetical protein